MAVYTEAGYIGNWRGDLEKSVTYPNGSQATVNLLCRIDRKGTGTLVTSTFYCNLGSSKSGNQYGQVSASLSKAGWTSSNQVRQFGSKAITVNRTHAAQTINYYGTFRIHWGDTTSNWYPTGALAVTIPAKASYTVSYNANGGSGAPASQTKWYGETLTLQSGIPTRTGYTFNGWNTAADGSGTNYSAGGSYTNNAAMTLYAKWTANTYTVVYNANNGTGTMSNSSFTYDTSGTLRANSFTRTDYVFAGWATSSTGAVMYADEASVTNLAPSGTFNLYAVWKYIYDSPDIQVADAYRTDNQHVADDAGTYGTITAYVVPAYMYSDLNTKAYTTTQVVLYYRVNGTSNYTQLSTTQISTPSTVTFQTSSGVFDADKQYDIKVEAKVVVSNSEKISTSYTTFISIAEFVVDFDPDGDSIGIFTIADGKETSGDENKLIYMNGDIVFMLDDSKASGTDYEIITALTALGWDVAPDLS